MSTETTPPIEHIRSLLRNEATKELAEALAPELAEDVADLIERLDPEERTPVLRALESEKAAYVMVELSTETARSIVQELPDFTLAHYLDILPMDDALDLREELGPEKFDDLLQIIPEQDAQEIRRLLAWPEDSVGRLMTERFFEVSPTTTVNQLLDDIRRASDEKYETINDVYVLSPDRHLIGLFSLRRALRASPETTAEAMMKTDFVAANARDTAEESARTMSRYGFYALPVLDERGRMVGIFTGDDAQTILQEEETRDIENLGAVSGDVEPYLSLSVVKLAWKRIPWLLALFAAETLTGLVMRHYGEQGQIAAYMFFLPLMIGAGGNAGSQVTTMITRSLAVGEIGSSDWFKIARREFAVSILVGGSLGIVGLLRASFWPGMTPNLMYSIGTALPAIIIFSTFVAGGLPLAARRLGIDPAVMSAPFISTFVDATGLIIFFEVVKAFHGGKLPIG